MLTFNTENMAPQYFALPAPTMNYIFKNLKPQHLIKLYQTSKFFYNKFRQNIIQNLEIVDNGEAEVLNPTKSVICVSNPILSKLADFWITDSFIYRSPLIDKYIAKFTNFHVKKVELCDYIEWEEYEALTKSGTIKEIKVKGIIRDDDPVCIEDIISRIPNATSIEISESTFSVTSYAALASLNHKAKLSNIIFRNITNVLFLDLELFTDFILKNADDDCNYCFEFKLYSGNDDIIREINEGFERFNANFHKYINGVLKQRAFTKFLSCLLFSLY